MEPRIVVTVKIPDVRGSVINGRKIGRHEVKKAIKQAICRSTFNGHRLFISAQRRFIAVI
jgi:hypothetical protein